MPDVVLSPRHSPTRIHRMSRNTNTYFTHQAFMTERERQEELFKNNMKIFLNNDSIVVKYSEI